MRLEPIPTVRRTSDMVGSEDEDVEMADGEATSAAKKAKRKQILSMVMSSKRKFVVFEPWDDIKY